MPKGDGGRYAREMRALLAEQEASGLSVAEFARERGLVAGKLYDWRRRLRQRAAREREERPEFVRIRLRPEQRALPALEVELAGGAKVRVPTGFDEDELRRLIGVLATC